MDKALSAKGKDQGSDPQKSHKSCAGVSTFQSRGQGHSLEQTGLLNKPNQSTLGSLRDLGCTNRVETDRGHH